MIYGRGVGSVTTLKTFQTWKTDGSSDVDTFIKNQIFGSEFYYSNGFIRADGPLGMMLFLVLSICFIFFLWEPKLSLTMMFFTHHPDGLIQNFYG